ncbi:MAG: hypothetical protein K1563_17540 [Candidatus Thiodiazotropha sp. (ex. Lucinisca nassula)]|nr:hypothetical protein [Candidatus Thiodiazotropha sp. (ex. Lucinisca nassula)]MBW9275485.1 hypothetical protein [Candidatus Thiodiazotropha sp. (ex. Lucinisca nassula)]
MANRTGTYVAFDGLGQTDPSKSDFRYYSTIQAWAAGKHFDFKYVNSHDKTYAVRDSSLRSTLESRIRERLAASKNCLVILSEDTRKNGSMLSYEIEQSVDRYGLPLIITYVGYEQILAPSKLFSRWPSVLAHRIYNDLAKAIHIPFKKSAINNAISQFSIQDNRLSGSLSHYSLEAHRDLGCA